MRDPAEIRRRIEKLLQRVERRDAYGQLLARGRAVAALADVEDPEAWRAELRRQARADKFRIRTGVNQRVVWALLLHRQAGARQDESDRYVAAMRSAIPRAAVVHRHQPAVWIRDGDETVCGCERCQAVGLVDVGREPLIGGTLFEDDCPHDDPPAATGATMLFGGA